MLFFYLIKSLDNHYPDIRHYAYGHQEKQPILNIDNLYGGILKL